MSLIVCKCLSEHDAMHNAAFVNSADAKANTNCILLDGFYYLSYKYRRSFPSLELMIISRGARSDYLFFIENGQMFR